MTATPGVTLAVAEARWNAEGRAFKDGLNRFLDRIYAGEDPGEEPRDSRGDLWQVVLDEVARLGHAGRHVEARRRFHPAWEPFADKPLSAGVFRAFYLDRTEADGGRIAVRVGAPHDATSCHVIDGDAITPLPGVRDVGRSVDRRWFARVYDDRIDVSDGWDGAPRRFRLPTHYAPILEAEAFGDRRVRVGPLQVETIDPFDDGSRVVLGTTTGVFLCYPDREAVLLWPGGPRLAKAVGRKTACDLELSYAHGAVSPDGRFLAVGDQDSSHVLLIRSPERTLRVNATPLSEYPNLARFHDQRPLVALASCHFARSGVRQHALSSIDAIANDREADEAIVTLSDRHWILAIAPLEDGWLLGDRNGYLWWVGFDGEPKGYLHLGSSCHALDRSPDGTRILAGMYSGHLVEVARAAARSPDLITNRPVTETRRYLFTHLHAPFRW